MGFSLQSPLTTFRAQLQSSAVAYQYGISGPWWYGAGATVQILLFAQAGAFRHLDRPCKELTIARSSQRNSN